MRAFLSLSTIALTLGYVLSQFYRGFLAVLSTTLHDELGATPADLALSSGLWFLAFAAVQPPVGWALDRFGPRRTVAATLALGAGGGAAVFASATQVWHLHLAMTLIGIGCAPALMGAYYIFAHAYPRAAFGTLAGAVVGFGSLGDMLGAAPLVGLIHAIGWRATLWAMAAATLAVAGLMLATVRDPVHHGGAPRGSLGALFAVRPLRLMMPLVAVSYASSAALRGLWASPYLNRVFGADDAMIGQVTLLMGLTMVLSNLAAGPFSRAVGTPRRATIAMHALALGTLAVLALRPGSSLALSVAALALMGATGVNYALLMTHARTFLPPHLVGRGVTLLNMASVGGVGVMQFASRPIFAWASARHEPAGAFAVLFLFFLLPLAAGTALYLLTPEGPDA